MTDISRRKVLGVLAAGTAVAACTNKREQKSEVQAPSMGEELNPRSAASHAGEIVLSVFPLTRSPWPTPDPFLFCAHHNDRYPKGRANFGPDASLAGRSLGQDFDWKDGWNMYHGEEVPGFPAHPHRGFETVTVVIQGRLDHADSLGAAARYGDGDVQWLTAGSGIQHAEMFPLLKQEQDNPLELFQIWLNLPKKNKMVAPHFKMLWADTIPSGVHKDARGKETRVTVRAGELFGHRAPAPAPHSWAGDPNNEVGIWNLELAPGAEVTLPPAGQTAATAGTPISRSLYFHDGSELRVAGRDLRARTGVNLDASRATLLKNGDTPARLLVLQGKPILEPIARRGPFVMNTEEEIRQAYIDYGQTRFGGWPWENSAPVHGADPARFARRGEEVERPG